MENIRRLGNLLYQRGIINDKYDAIDMANCQEFWEAHIDMDDFEKVFPGEPLNDETLVDYYERTPAALLAVYEMITGNGDD